MPTFGNIKKICSLASKEKAKAYTKEFGKEFDDNNQSETITIFNREQEVMDAVKNRGISGYHSIGRSGGQDKEGNWWELLPLTLVFYKDAPKLKNILNRINRSFKINIRNGKTARVNVFDNKSAPDLFYIAHYFVGAEDFYVVDLASGEIFRHLGYQAGAAYKEKEGVVMGLNVEKVPSIDTIVHELVHLKLSDELSQKGEIVWTVTERTVETLTERVTNELTKLGYDQELTVQEIQEERMKAIENFKLLDKDFAQFLPPME